MVHTFYSKVELIVIKPNKGMLISTEKKIHNNASVNFSGNFLIISEFDNDNIEKITSSIYPLSDVILIRQTNDTQKN